MSSVKDCNELSIEYLRRFGDSAGYRNDVWFCIVNIILSPYIPTDSSVLDLGAGWGEFIRNVSARERYAMDLNPDMPSRIGTGIKPLSQDCSQPWPLESSSLDVVFSSNFFEHLPTKDALRQTLKECFRCLKPGGRVLCIGPNIRCLPGEYWDFFDHYLPLTERSLVEILELTGFKTERVVPRFLPFTMSQGFTPPTFLISAYLRLPILWRFIGKQFFIVMRKPPLHE